MRDNIEEFNGLYRAALSGRLSRRQVLRHATALGISGGALAVLLAACGGSSGSSSTATSSGGSSGSSSTSTSTSASGSPAASSSGGTPKQGGSIIIGTLGEAAGINPFVASESESTWRTQMIFGQLVTVDPKTLKPAPSFATKWDINNLTFTFHLRDAKFSDGSNLTADDFAFTIKGLLDKKTASPYQTFFTSIQGASDFVNGTAQDVTGVKVIDPKTLQVTLATPDASFLFNTRYIKPVPSKQLQGKDLSTASKDPFWQHPVGAGPFKYVSWTVNGDFVAQRNPNYYDAPKPYLDKFTHRVISDSDSLVNSLLSGDIDGSIYPNPAAKKQLEANSKLAVLVPPFNEIDGWYFNLKNPYLAKQEVRQAVAYALDMEQFAKDSLYGLGKPAAGPIAQGNYALDPSLKPWPYDLNKAKTLIQQAGKPPDGIVFACNQGNVLRQDFLTYTQSQLSKIGWKITPKTIEWATLVNQTLNKQFDVVVGPGSATVSLDPGELFEEYSTNGSENDMSYSNPQLDTLLKQAKQELDIQKQIPIYKQIQDTLYQQFPSTFAWYRPYLHVFQNKFAGYTLQNVLVEGVFDDLENWYVKG